MCIFVGEIGSVAKTRIFAAPAPGGRQRLGYCQLPDDHPLRERDPTTAGTDGGGPRWTTSFRTAGAHVDPDRASGFVDGDRPVLKHTRFGTFQNEDVVLTR